MKSKAAGIGKIDFLIFYAVHNFYRFGMAKFFRKWSSFYIIEIGNTPNAGKVICLFAFVFAAGLGLRIAANKNEENKKIRNEFLHSHHFLKDALAKDIS
jgi:hypothetical protein